MKRLQYKHNLYKVYGLLIATRPPPHTNYGVEYLRILTPMLYKVHYIFTFLMDKLTHISWILDASNPPHGLWGGGALMLDEVERNGSVRYWRVMEKINIGSANQYRW
jgi:hypothetical protein